MSGVKFFLKTIPTKNPIARSLMRKHGQEAFTWLSILLELAQDIGSFDLTIDDLSENCNIKNPRLSRVFNDVKDSFIQAQKVLGILDSVELSSTQNDLSSTNDQLSSFQVELSSTSHGEKPHGSTRDLDKSREEKNRVENIIKKEKNISAPESFEIDEKFKVWLEEKAYPEEWAKFEIEHCLDWHRAKGNKFSDWKATIRNWLNKGAGDIGSLSRWKKNQEQPSVKVKPTCPAAGDPDYERKMNIFLASIPVGASEYKRHGS